MCWGLFESPALDTTEWFQLLGDWECDRPDLIAAPANQDDKRLLRTLIEKHAIPRIRLDILYRWEPTQQHETQLLLQLVRIVSNRWPNDASTVTMLEVR